MRPVSRYLIAADRPRDGRERGVHLVQCVEVILEMPQFKERGVPFLDTCSPGKHSIDRVTS